MKREDTIKLEELRHNMEHKFKEFFESYCVVHVYNSNLEIKIFFPNLDTYFYVRNGISTTLTVNEESIDMEQLKSNYTEILNIFYILNSEKFVTLRDNLLANYENLLTSLR